MIEEFEADATRADSYAPIVSFVSRRPNQVLSGSCDGPLISGEGNIQFAERVNVAQFERLAARLEADGATVRRQLDLSDDDVFRSLLLTAVDADGTVIFQTNGGDAVLVRTGTTCAERLAAENSDRIVDSFDGIALPAGRTSNPPPVSGPWTEFISGFVVLVAFPLLAISLLGQMTLSFWRGLREFRQGKRDRRNMPAADSRQPHERTDTNGLTS